MPLTLTTLLRPDSKRLKADNEPPDLHKEIVDNVNPVAKSVHCGLLRLHAALLGAYAQCPRLVVTGRFRALFATWKKLSTSVVVVNKKLRRLSTVKSLRGSDARPYGGIGREE